ncbi:MAG: hypothetical protein ACRDBF_08780, partial [Plesiomonas shigelloides]
GHFAALSGLYDQKMTGLRYQSQDFKRLIFTQAKKQRRQFACIILRMKIIKSLKKHKVIINAKYHTYCI